jgi:GNAT superfamily N-acetyltransferase
MRLTVAAGYRRQGIGSRLYKRVLAFAKELQAVSIRASYVEYGLDEPARFFLTERGFTELRRDYTSRLDVGACDLRPFEELEERLTAEGIGFLTYADVPDTDANRRRLFALYQEAQSQLPYADDPEPSEPQPYETSWVGRLRQERFSTVQLAYNDGRSVGYTSSGVSWGITGVVPDCRRRGIATVLKVRAIRSAKDRGVQILETENRADNIGMMTINRRLGYQFAPPVIECIKWLL